MIERVEFWRMSINCRCRTPPHICNVIRLQKLPTKMPCRGSSPKRPLWICGSKEPQQMKLCSAILCCQKDEKIQLEGGPTKCSSPPPGFWILGRWVCLLLVSKSSRVARGNVQSRCNKAAPRKVQPTTKTHNVSIKSLAKDSRLQVYTFQLHLYHHHTTCYPFDVHTHKKPTTFDFPMFLAQRRIR